MKYVFFDCFAGFTAPMAAAALADMTAGGELFSKIAASLPNLGGKICEVKRCSMEAAFAEFSLNCQSEKITSDEILLLCSQAAVGKYAHSQLERFYAVRAEARSIKPADAVFDLATELPIIASAAFVFETLFSLEAEKIYVSKILCSNAHRLGENGFSPFTTAETVYTCKKHKLDTSASPIEAELTTEDGAALLASLGATIKASPLGNIIKIGYGAGEKDFANTPNILRGVWGDEDEGAIVFEAELANLFTEFATMEA